MSETLAEKWAQPRVVSDVELAFPASVQHLMPPYAEIPEEFRLGNGAWNKWAAGWFFDGLKAWPQMREGIDAELAQRHLRTIIGSFEPKHEHKQAAIAYLASLWMVAP